MKGLYTFFGVFLVFSVVGLVVCFLNHDDSNDMSIARCKSLGGFADNDGWGNYTCYKNGDIIE